MATKRIGLSDVAARAGVSMSTVSRILNGNTSYASAETIARVTAIAGELGYHPAYAARALRTSESRLVALLNPDITNGSFAAIVDSIESALAESDYSMILCNTRESSVVQDRHLAEMMSHRVHAIIMLGAVESSGLSRVLEQGTPIVFVNRKCPLGIGAFVGIDDYAAGRAVADHFARRGYEPAAVVHGPVHSSSSRLRMRGFRDRLGELGLKIGERQVIETTLTMAGGYASAARLLEAGPRPRAVFCANDQIAYGVFRRCRELGIRVPRDVALVGFDNNPLNEWLAPWLSTVDIPHKEFGPAVSRVLAELDQVWPADQPPEVLLPFTVVVRDSG